MKVASKNSVLMVEISSVPSQLMACRDWTITTARNIIDVSTIATEWKEYLPGQIEATLSFTLLFDTANSEADAAIETAQWAGTPVTFHIRPAGSATGSPDYVLSGYITQWDIAAATEDAIQVSVSAQGTGAIRKDVISA